MTTEAPHRESVEERVWLDLAGAAEYVGMDKSTVWRARAANRLRGYKVGRNVRFHRDDLDAWIRGESR